MKTNIAKVFLSLMIFFFCTSSLVSQELYITSPAAANISKGRLEVRNTVEGYDNFNYFHNSFEVNYGLLGNLTIYNKFYYTFEDKYKFIGSYQPSVRYRFKDFDSKNQHYRFAYQSGLNIPLDPVSVTGDAVSYELHPGHIVKFLSGANNITVPIIDFHATDNYTFKNSLIGTALFNKFAVSLETGYNMNVAKSDFKFGNYWNFGAAFGYLLLPRQYTSYNDVNVNLYFENKAYYFEGNKFEGRDVRNSGGFRYDAYFGVQSIFFSSLMLEAMYKLPVHSNEFIFDDTRALMLSVRYLFFL